VALTGDKLVAMQTVQDRQDTSGNTSSTSYTATLTGGTTCARTFVAPPSGAVLIHNKFYGYNGNVGVNFTFCSPEVRAGGVIGSGALVLTAADAEAVVVSQVNAQSVTRYLAGLTPGSTYNARQMFRVDGNNGTYIFKELIIQPVP